MLEMMRKITRRSVVLGFLLVGMIALASLGGCKKKAPPGLVLVSANNEFVKKEFERAFCAWHLEKYGQPVTLEWRDLGGSAQITKFVTAQYAHSDSSGVDVFFGGGAPEHIELGRKGLLEKIQLSPETLAQIPQSLNGVALYDAQAGWYGSCLSSFGIFCNVDVLAKAGVPAPQRWEDLANPALYGQTGTAGAQSASVMTCYELILQTAPDWPTGWRRLLAFWGNCQAFTKGSSNLPPMVANGQILLCPCIDYYALMQINDKPGALKFILPQEGTAVTPDPISVLKGAPNKEMAQRFVEFVLSERGQALWFLPAGTSGGPQAKTLYRLPIRKDVYENYAGKMPAGMINPYAIETGFKLDEKLQAARVSQILPRLLKAAGEDNNERLHQAWKVVLDKGQPAELTAEFFSLPENLATQEAVMATAEKLAQAERDDDTRAIDQVVTQWTQFFREKYDRIIEKK